MLHTIKEGDYITVRRDLIAVKRQVKALGSFSMFTLYKGDAFFVVKIDESVERWSTMTILHHTFGVLQLATHASWNDDHITPFLGEL